ncbi:hypothetical protein BMR05_15300, partial [Methylococcaceae bacterium HT4]
MARLPRITPAGVPVDLVQRGNNRQACYGFEEEHNWGQSKVKCDKFIPKNQTLSAPDGMIVS